MKTNKNKQNPKIRKRTARRKRRSHLKHNFFSEYYMYDPLNVFSKPMRQLIIGQCVKIPKGTKIMRKNIQN